MQVDKKSIIIVLRMLQLNIKNNDYFYNNV